MMHPCCGFSLRNGSIILAVIDLVGSIFGILSTIVTFISIIGYDRAGKKKILHQKSELGHGGLETLMEDSAVFVISILVFVTLMCLLELALAIVLLRGAKLRNVFYCNAWWKIKCILFFLSTSMILFALITSEDKSFLDFVVGGVFGIIYQLYALWVVKAFINELVFATKCEQNGIEKL